MVAPAPRLIAGAGTSEDAWAAWLSGVPRIPAATLFGSCARIVVVSPHPDDEALGCGGVIALAKDCGIAVRVLAITDGERCYPGHPALEASLRVTRRRELLEAGAVLGMDGEDVRFFALPDGDLTSHTHALSEILKHELRQDDLVVSPWRWDGHPDHEACFAATASASDAVGCRLVEYPIWGWHWAAPTDSHWAAATAVCVPLPTTVRARKQRAIDRFRSQIAPPPDVPAAAVLSEDTLLRFRRDIEMFFV